MLRGAEEQTIAGLSAALRDFLSKPPLFDLETGAPERAAAWDDFCDTLFKTFQENALDKVGQAPILGQEKLSIPSVWFGEKPPNK